MQRIFSGILALGVGLAPATIVLSSLEAVWGQTQTPQTEALQRLFKQAGQQTQQRKPQQAIETWQQVLKLARQLKNKTAEATALAGIGFNLQSIGQIQKALAYFNQSLPILQAVGNRAGEVFTLNNIGLVYRAIGQPQKALAYFNQSLPILQAVGNRAGEATTLDNIGATYSAIGQPQKALAYFNQSLLISQAVGDRAGEAATLNNIGGVYRAIGQPQKALAYFNQSLPISQAVGNRAGEATTLNNIGATYSAIGQPQKALAYFNQSLPIRQAVGDRAGEATTLSNIGLVYRDIGQPQKALAYFNQSLPISQAMGDRAEEATTLNNIGATYSAIGQPQQALAYFNQSLPISQAVGDRAGEAATLSNIGLVYRDIGQPQKALAYYTQSLPIRQAVGDRAGEAATLNNIGATYRDIGQPQQALAYYTQSLPIRQTVGDRAGEATTLSNIGLVYRDIGQPQKALAYYTQSLPIRQAVGDRAGEARTLSNIGAVYRTTGQPQKALAYFNQSLPISQAVGDRAGKAATLNNIGLVYSAIGQAESAVANWEQSVTITLETRRGLVRANRAAFLQTQGGTAVALVSLLVNRHQPALAYQWANLATTADLADYTRLINANKVANPQAQAALDAWNQQNQQLQLLRQRLQEPGQFSAVLAQQMRDLEAQVNRQAEENIRDFPEIADLLETTPTDIAQLQASIPTGTTVIQPVLLTGITNVPDTIALFVLTRDSLNVQKIPVDPEQLDAVLSQTYAQLTNHLDGNATYLENLATLYNRLIRPIENQIQATKPKQLSFITTGKLRYIPFEALYDSKTDQYLIQKYPVSYLTRLSVNALKPLQTGSAAAVQTPKMLALGNPVPKAPLDLQGAEQEVKQIVPIFPGSQPLLGSAATLNAFKLQSPRFSLLHLATHGCFQKGGCAKLGLKENTLLFADQRFNIADAALLGLQGVDLITLSACQTALETNSNGEEIAGLAYLFERAGAKATIASLWSAEDRTTQAIMVQFYTNLKKGMSKGEALQKAKLSQIDSHPFFWAAFVLIGDAR